MIVRSYGVSDYRLASSLGSSSLRVISLVGSLGFGGTLPPPQPRVAGRRGCSSQLNLKSAAEQLIGGDHPRIYDSPGVAPSLSLLGGG